ncbi:MULTISPECIES: GNAT family N-acetyltransferase [Kitasatospora]|uniref:Putative acetyltransferase n=1 Tax=Kitasatospora setae (strain ATCC 33774 / DSM 43861 / JCM 3304 / KCC A-0304 / NBRC 14216 / KM-6054) TaxID=452652 RepID=E4MZU1_KITSK|nr:MULTISPECIES: GNAT family N-acetyltransferase [Kitasatospora]BAJ30025.1 putative acetyltransferase [Kitasatospora setae KM-6054]
MSITIRPYQEGDAHDIAELYNRHRDNPNPVAGGITGAELERELAERDTATFLVAVEDGRVVGTFGLFHSTGRRSARAGELIADMFFVAPAYRNGVITGRLFTEAVEWMMRCGCLVLRLTVNPANTVAFKLYRRVGCVSVGETVPGEDGNVELHNYIPLILRGVFHDLGPEAVAELGKLSSFGSVTDGRDGELRSDVRLVDGVRTVGYALALGGFKLTAGIDVDRGLLLDARLTDPDGATRQLRIAEAPYEVKESTGGQPHRFGGDGLTAELDPAEGTLTVHAEGHHGPVFVSTWPSAEADRSAGWREGQARTLEVRAVEHGVEVSERTGGNLVTGTLTLHRGVLEQQFSYTTRPGRIFQTVGLRQGEFALTGPDGAERHPIGTGIGVRDTSEVVAAARTAPAGSALAWTDGTTRVALPAGHPVRLITATLVERHLVPDADGTARLRTEFATGPDRAATRTASVGQPLDGQRKLTVKAAAGGITGWTEDGTKVLRSPAPRTRAFGCNPRWRAGAWVTREHHRHSLATGLGWGVATPEWEQKHPLGLAAPQEGVSWEVTAPERTAEPVRLDVHAPGADEETVLWLTPDTPADTAVVIDSAGTRHALDSGAFRQVWAAAAAVRLTGGHWLHLTPAGPAGTQEIVLRTTSSGLLIGCASAGADAAWQLSVHPAPAI